MPRVPTEADLERARLRGARAWFERPSEPVGPEVIAAAEVRRRHPKLAAILGAHEGEVLPGDEDDA